MQNRNQQRKQSKANRKAIPIAEQQLAAAKIAQTINNLTAFQISINIAAYSPIQAEIDPQPLIAKIWELHKNCYLPVVTKIDEPLTFAKYNQNDKLSPGHYKILEPKPAATISPQELDLVIVPLVGFTADGYRLGNGGGFYDRTFSFKKELKINQPILLGIGYEQQLITDFGPQPWDIQLDIIITEQIIRKLS